jgi:hypothetical protein
LKIQALLKKGEIEKTIQRAGMMTIRNETGCLSFCDVLTNFVGMMTGTNLKNTGMTEVETTKIEIEGIVETTEIEIVITKIEIETETTVTKTIKKEIEETKMVETSARKLKETTAKIETSRNEKMIKKMDIKKKILLLPWILILLQM